MHQYPAYRKYKVIDVWFKIISDRHFVELKKIGEKWIKHEVKAEQYPEIILIQDMLACAEGRWEVMNKEDFEAALVKAE